MQLRERVLGALYLAAATVSSIHSVELFSVTNPLWLAVGISACFELGAVACLYSLNRSRGWLVGSLFLLVTAAQVLGNVYQAYSDAGDFSAFSELLGLQDMEAVVQRRILALSTAGILPLVALGFAGVLWDSRNRPDATVAAERVREETTAPAAPTTPDPRDARLRAALDALAANGSPDTARELLDAHNALWPGETSVHAAVERAGSHLGAR